MNIRDAIAELDQLFESLFAARCVQPGGRYSTIFIIGYNAEHQLRCWPFEFPSGMRAEAFQEWLTRRTAIHNSGVSLQSLAPLQSYQKIDWEVMTATQLVAFGNRCCESVQRNYYEI